MRFTEEIRDFWEDALFLWGLYDKLRLKLVGRSGEMEFRDVLKERRSARRFKPDQITEEQLDLLLEAAERAPVGSSMYCDIHLTVVQEQSVLLRLCEAAWERFSTREKVEEIAGAVADKTPVAEGRHKPNLFYGAPTVIFVSHRKQTLQPGIEYSNVSGIVNQMHLAATDLGLGSCYMWGALESMRMLPHLDHTDVLDLPEGFEPLLALAVGYPEEEPQAQSGHGPLSVNYVK